MMTGKTMKNKTLLACLVWSVQSAAAATRHGPPSGTALLRASLSVSSVPFVALVRVQSFDPNRKAKAQYWRMSSGPDGVRVEATAKRGGDLALLELNDRKTRLQAWPKAGRAWLGPATKANDALELTMYDLFVSTGARVAGHSTWRLDMRSKEDGRARRSLWIDKKNARVLRLEDYRRDGFLSRRERVMRIDDSRKGDPPFAVQSPAGHTVTNMHTPYVVYASTPPRDSMEPLYADWTPIGFVLYEKTWANDHWILVYSDGLRQVSLVEGRRGAKGPHQAPIGASGPPTQAAAFLDSTEGLRLEWQSSSLSFTLTGDLIEADLKRMADSVAVTP